MNAQRPAEQMVKRYLNWCQPTHGHEMMEDSEGPWVAFEDYERLRSALVGLLGRSWTAHDLSVEIHKYL